VAPLTFYTNPMSRGRMVRWMLEEVGAPYETVVVSYGEAMKSADYLAMNPMGKVPAIRHGETVVTETPAIIAYLADAFPEAGLAPPPSERGAYYRWLFFGAGCVDPAIMARGLKLEPPNDAAGRVGYGTVDLVIDTLEKAVSASPFVAGEAFTAADVYIGSQIAFGIMVRATDERPAFRAYLARVQAREGYRRAVEKDDAAMAAA